ncbi:MAG: hypothetical protein HYW47_02245 [Deltaproteobacteria bacterium]|nr:hypothetical protein [Deltaproteobacteria bacterium]
MEIKITSEPIDQIKAGALVSDIYARDFPLKGHLGMLDWRLYGFFSHLLEDAKLTGRLRETYLIPSQNKTRTQYFLLAGLGSKTRLTEKKVSSVVPHVLKTLRRMKVQEFVLVPLGWQVLGFNRAFKLFMQELHKNEPLFPSFFFKKMIVYIPPEAKKSRTHVSKMLPFIQKRMSHV